MVTYIGITDFTNNAEVQRMVKVFEESFQNKQPRKLMVGVMMSYKTLNNLETKWASAWPDKNALGEIFQPHPSVLNTLHYADFGFQTVAGDLSRALKLADVGNGLDALQLDMPWPEKKDIDVAMNSFMRTNGKNVPIVLQVGTKAIQMCSGDRNAVISRIGSYQGIVGCVLLDLSGGKGIDMDTDFMISYISEIKNRYPYISIAIAGGLGPTTVRFIEKIVNQFPDLSIDAQGNLRVSRNAMDPVNWDMAATYIQEAAKVFK